MIAFRHLVERDLRFCCGVDARMKHAQNADWNQPAHSRVIIIFSSEKGPPLPSRVGDLAGEHKGPIREF